MKPATRPGSGRIPSPREHSKRPRPVFVKGRPGSPSNSRRNARSLDLAARRMTSGATRFPVSRRAHPGFLQKKIGSTLPAVADQSGHYGGNLPDFIQAITPGRLPFLYESTGIETFFPWRTRPRPTLPPRVLFPPASDPGSLGRGTRHAPRPARPAAGRASAGPDRAAGLPVRGPRRPGAVLCLRPAPLPSLDSHERIWG
jgi:hypothetical protein